MSSIIGKIKDMEDERRERKSTVNSCQLPVESGARILRELNELEKEFQSLAKDAAELKIPLNIFLRHEIEYKKKRYKLQRELNALEKNLDYSATDRTVVFSEDEFEVLKGLIKEVMSEHFEDKDGRGFLTIDQQILEMNEREYEAFTGALEKLDIVEDPEDAG